MSKKTYTVEQYSRRYEFVSKLRKGLMITFLFTALSAGAATADTYTASFAEESHQVITLASAAGSVDMADGGVFELLASQNYQKQDDAESLQAARYGALMGSYYDHKGDQAGEAMQQQYGILASSLSKLPYNDMMARYSVNNEVNMLVMTFSNGLELDVTQVASEKDVAFSIYHGETLLYVGSEHPAALQAKLMPVINKTVIDTDGLS